jgi:hypothetical protein
MNPDVSLPVQRELGLFHPEMFHMDILERLRLE